MPGTGIWMLLDDAKHTNIYFSSLAYAATSYIESHPRATMPPKFVPIAAHPELWDFQAMAIGEHPKYYLYHTEKRRWTLRSNRCPVHRCELIGYDSASHWPSWYICDICMPAFTYWTTWFPIALMAANREFAETEGQQRRKTYVEREVRQSQLGRGSHEQSINHAYHVVTFDLSVKQIPAPAELLELPPEEPAHPTWLEKARKEETVLYVHKHIEQTQRTFKHERYVNMRGKTIDVQDHDKRIPMSIKRLKYTIYQATSGQHQ